MAIEIEINCDRNFQVVQIIRPITITITIVLSFILYLQLRLDWLLGIMHSSTISSVSVGGKLSLDLMPIDLHSSIYVFVQII